VRFVLKNNAKEDPLRNVIVTSTEWAEIQE
jgi:hypothetical protein